MRLNMALPQWLPDPACEPELGKIAEAWFTIPDAHPLLSPIVFMIPLQLLSYHIAGLRGADVDKPRNLAKSMTVE